MTNERQPLPDGYPAMPETERLVAAREQSAVISEFLWFLDDKGWAICRPDSSHGVWLETGFNREELLAEFFEIDLKVVSEERQRILEYIRKRREEEDGQIL